MPRTWPFPASRRQSPARRPTHPLSHAVRTKPRRLPLVLRFTKGSIHSIILGPVIWHCVFTSLIVYLDRHVTGNLGLPTSVVPSLAIVVGLMLVFRNGTSYDRFWTGRNSLQGLCGNVRNLVRGAVVYSAAAGELNAKEGGGLTDEEKRDVEQVVRSLIAILYAVKHNLRAEYYIGDSLATSSFSATRNPSISGNDAALYTDSPVDLSASLATAVETPPNKPVYTTLLPSTFQSHEDQGLGLPVQLTILIEAFIARGVQRAWFHMPLASQLTAQLNSLIDNFGRMETIRSTPIPVAHLIHQTQTLFLFLSLLPFATVDDFGWYAVPLVGIVAFTLYGIEGIGKQLEDPFGYDKNDIKMDGVVEDTRREIDVLLEEWRRASGANAESGGWRLFERTAS